MIILSVDYCRYTMVSECLLACYLSIIVGLDLLITLWFVFESS